VRIVVREPEIRADIELIVFIVVEDDESDPMAEHPDPEGSSAMPTSVALPIEGVATGDKRGFGVDNHCHASPPAWHRVDF
jgi:hypothetical protein